jgi:hypothetical protein
MGAAKQLQEVREGGSCGRQGACCAQPSLGPLEEGNGMYITTENGGSSGVVIGSSVSLISTSSLKKRAAP